jgi:hypothetical protein
MKLLESHLYRIEKSMECLWTTCKSPLYSLMQIELLYELLGLSRELSELSEPFGGGFINRI